MRRAVKLRVRDKDGKAFYFVGFDRVETERLRDEMVAEARRIGCFIREVPHLGSLYEPPYHRSFEVGHRNGVITRIARRAASA